MATENDRKFKPNLLCIAPPYGNRIPAGSAYLLGYLKAHGCFDFDFLDLRLGAPFDFTPSYKTTGVFGESYVLDVPDLPLALGVIRAFEEGAQLSPKRSKWFDRYCLERGISPHYLLSYLTSLDRYLERCFAQVERIDFIGFSTWTPNYLSTLMAAAHLKRRQHPPMIVAGGPQVTASSASAEMGLRSGLFDVVALGEGEQTLLDLYQTYRRTGSVRNVEGTIVHDPASNTLIRTERQQLRLESLPIPSFEEMPLAAYQERRELRSLPFQLSRGCTDKCSFCSEWVFWQRYRSDTPDHAVEQIKVLLQRYNANFIDFSDSLLNGHPKRLVSFAERVLADGVEFGWTSFMRAQMDQETAQLLARSGCSGVFIGIESFSDEALALMNKRRTEAQNIQAVIAFVEAGIHVTAGFIPGFPGDSRPGFLHSLAVLGELQERYPGKIELHEEPFTVMANAPIMKQLDTVGLSPCFWAEEFIDILPTYADITGRVVCSVEGREQGVERIGRTALVGAIKTDSPVKGKFVEGLDDDMVIDRFRAYHIFGGWYLVYKKSLVGHRYCLLLNDSECDDLLERQGDWFPVDETRPEIAEQLDQLEARHTVPPDRAAQRVVRSLFNCHDYSNALLTVSPFVIARELGWRHNHQLLLVDTVTELSHRRPDRETCIFKTLVGTALNGDGLWRQPGVRERFGERQNLFSALDELRELGILIICDYNEAEHGKGSGESASQMEIPPVDSLSLSGVTGRTGSHVVGTDAKLVHIERLITQPPDAPRR
jgi:hypothetical protein